MTRTERHSGEASGGKNKKHRKNKYKPKKKNNKSRVKKQQTRPELRKEHSRIPQQSSNSGNNANQSKIEEHDDAEARAKLKRHLGYVRRRESRRNNKIEHDWHVYTPPPNLEANMIERPCSALHNRSLSTLQLQRMPRRKHCACATSDHRCLQQKQVSSCLRHLL